MPEGNLLHSKHVLKQGSHEGNEVWWMLSNTIFFTQKKTKGSSGVKRRRIYDAVKQEFSNVPVRPETEIRPGSPQESTAGDVIPISRTTLPTEQH